MLIFFSKVFLGFIIKIFFRPLYHKSVKEYAAKYCLGPGRVLDIGCNDGRIGNFLMKRNPDMQIMGAEIRKVKCKIPVVLYDGENIPYADNVFDTVMLIDILHHTADIHKVLQEAARVSKKHIIVKDHFIRDPYRKFCISVGDFLSNFPDGIRCEYNYRTLDWWHSTMDELRLTVVDKIEDQNYGWGMKDSFNFFYKLEKQ